MARRTKEDAAATRASLLDAAERLFHAQGVSRTSLHDIAEAAGTSRGAIYWHFQDKADLFNAMMDRVTLPLEQALCGALLLQQREPAQALRHALVAALHAMATDERIQRVFEVATHKVEYVDALRAVRERHIAARATCMGQMRLALGQARGLPCATQAAELDFAAQGLFALVDGLIQNWLLAPGAFDLVAAGARAIDTYLQGLGLAPAGDQG